MCSAEPFGSKQNFFALHNAWGVEKFPKENHYLEKGVRREGANFEIPENSVYNAVMFNVHRLRLKRISIGPLFLKAIMCNNMVQSKFAFLTSVSFLLMPPPPTGI